MIEIGYVIEEKESEKYELAAIRLVELKKDGINTIIKDPSQSITLAIIKQSVNLEEKKIIDFLVKEETEFRKKHANPQPLSETAPLSIFHVGRRGTALLLSLLQNSLKLYCKNKPIVIDLFTKAVFYYRVEPLSNNRLQVTGRLKWPGTDISVRECDHIGPGIPPWFIKGVSLKTIATDIDFKDLQKAYLNDSFILSHDEKASFLERLDPEDPDCPQIVMAVGTEEDMQKMPDPHPVLILADRSGTCADLRMDYGNERILSFCDAPEHIVDEKRNASVTRNIHSERAWEKDLLETDFIRKEVNNSRYYCPGDKVARSLTFLLELGWHIRDRQGRKVMRQEQTDLTLAYEHNAITVRGKIRFESYEADVGNVMGAFNRRERFVQLGTDCIGLLPDRWAQPELRELAEEGEWVSDSIRINKNRIGAIDTLLKSASGDSTLSLLRDKLQNFSGIQEALPGKAFQGLLRPYQQQGLNWLAFLREFGFHGILADDMGLGKTVQVLAFLSRIEARLPHLIVVPTSLLFNWKNEIEKFLPGCRLYIHKGIGRVTEAKDLSQYSLILTSYTTLRNDIALFRSLSYHSIVLDEAQVIKNAHTQISQAVCSLHGQFRLSISGTPVENRLNELWSHFRFLLPDLFGDEQQFTADLASGQSDPRYIRQIKKKIAPFLLRRKKEDVAKDLPERIDQVVWVEMSDEHRRHYNNFLSGVRTGLLKKVETEGASKHRPEILEAILRLRQICCSPLLVSFTEDIPPLGAKFDRLIEDLETIVEEGRKVLVYSQFTSMLHLMTKASRERGWKYSYLDGTTVNREKEVQSFQNDPSVSIFFISLKAGGVGLNLTAADYVFLYDPWWNEAAEEQAVNRAHRLGRTNTVITKRYVTTDSIEEKMMSLKKAKRGVIDEIFDDSVGSGDITGEDLCKLLQ